MLAITKILNDPRTAVYLAKQRATGKSSKAAIRCLKRHLVRRVYDLLKDPNSVPTTVCLTEEPSTIGTVAAPVHSQQADLLCQTDLDGETVWELGWREQFPNAGG